MRAVAGAFGAPPKATDAFGAHEWFIMQTSQERPVEKEDELARRCVPCVSRSQHGQAEACRVE